VTALEGLEVLLELLPAYRNAATPARVRVERLRVAPGAPVNRLLRLLREHLQRREDVQLVLFDLLVDAEPLQIQSLCLRELMLRALLLDYLHVVHLLVALGDWEVLLAGHAAAICGRMRLGRGGVLLLVVIRGRLVRDLPLKHAARAVIREHQVALRGVERPLFQLKLLLLLLVLLWDQHVPTRPGGCLVEALGAPA
jgi:hypothetical protein